MDIRDKYFKNGKLMLIPRKEKNKLAVLTFFAQQLQQSQSTTFTEKEVNDQIRQYYDDYAIIRRYLVDYQFLLRDDYGRQYVLNQDKILP